MNLLRRSSVLLSLVVFSLIVPRIHGADTATPKQKSEIPEAGDLKLDWAWQPLIAGPLFFLSVHRSGAVHIFNRDEKSGDIKFMQSIPLAADLGRAGTHVDPYLAFSTKHILYVAGEWTHAHGDGDAIGLSWYQIDPKNGAFKKLGNIPCAAGVLYPTPDPNTLYLAAHFADQIHVIKLDPSDGKPTVAEKITGKGIGHGLQFSPDRKFAYSMGGDGTLGWLTCAPDGKLTYAGSLTLPELKAGKDNLSLFISPEGKHVYAALFKRYDPSDTAYVALLKRDEQSGALSFGEKLPAGSMGGVGQVTFTPDGRTAYACADPEKPASGLSYIKRDPETGKLSDLTKVPGANPAAFFAYAPDTGTLYLAGTWSTKTFKIYDALKSPPTKP